MKRKFVHKAIYIATCFWFGWMTGVVAESFGWYFGVLMAVLFFGYVRLLRD